jgi:hypothetical protein
MRSAFSNYFHISKLQVGVRFYFHREKSISLLHALSLMGCGIRVFRICTLLHGMCAQAEHGDFHWSNVQVKIIVRTGLPADDRGGITKGTAFALSAYCILLRGFEFLRIDLAALRENIECRLVLLRG